MNLDDVKTTAGLEELNKKAESDLKDAKFIEWGIDQKDAEIANTLKAKLENMQKNLVTQCEQITEANGKNEKFLKFFNNALETQDSDMEELLKSNIDQLNDTVDKNKKAFDLAQESLALVDEVLNELKVTIGEDGKAYISKTAVAFAKLIMKL